MLGELKDGRNKGLGEKELSERHKGMRGDRVCKIGSEEIVLKTVEQPRNEGIERVRE